MIQNLMTGGASIEDTLALWASSLREAKRVSASSNPSMQKSVSSVIGSRQLSNRRLNRSTTASLRSR
jgi:hypothetical protein